MSVLKRIALLLGLILPVLLRAGDQEREADYAVQLSAMQLIGKSLPLEADGKKFFSLYTETVKPENQGTVILLHDMGGHPNQAPFIAALRTYLPRHNWATLSIQLPLREAGSNAEDYYELFPEAAARIKAAVKYAKDNKSTVIVLAGHGLGGLMAVYTQAEQAEGVAGLITLGLPVPKTSHKAAQTLEFIKKIKLPWLDIYGENKSPEVTATALDRRLAARANPGFRQLLLDDPDPAYPDDENFLTKRVYSWLAKTFAQSAKTPAAPQP